MAHWHYFAPRKDQCKLYHLSSMHFYAWQKGLKTGMYYLRSKAATDPIKFTVKQKAQKQVAAAKNVGVANSVATLPENEAQDSQVCNLDDPDCLMCGS